MQRQNPTSKTNIGVGCHAVSVTMLGMVGPPGGGSGVSWSRGMQWAMAKAPITITPGASYLIRDHIPNLTLILACVLCAGIWWESIGDWGGGGLRERRDRAGDKSFTRLCEHWNKSEQGTKRQNMLENIQIAHYSQEYYRCPKNYVHISPVSATVGKRKITEQINEMDGCLSMTDW